MAVSAILTWQRIISWKVFQSRWVACIAYGPTRSMHKYKLLNPFGLTRQKPKLIFQPCHKNNWQGLLRGNMVQRSLEQTVGSWVWRGDCTLAIPGFICGSMQHGCKNKYRRGFREETLFISGVVIDASRLISWICRWNEFNFSWICLTMVKRIPGLEYRRWPTEAGFVDFSIEPQLFGGKFITAYKV